MKKVVFIMSVSLVSTLSANEGSSAGFGLMSLIVLYLLITGKFNF